MLVSSYYQGNTGTYTLHLAQFPEPFIVPTGDEGGPMTNGGDYSGSLSLGDSGPVEFYCQRRRQRGPAPGLDRLPRQPGVSTVRAVP